MWPIRWPLGIDATGVSWGSLLVKIGAVFGLGTVMLVMLLGQSRVFFSMSRDGLLPKWAADIHPKFRTPWISTILVGVIVAVLPAFLTVNRLAELVNIGTLAGVHDRLRRVCGFCGCGNPDLPRPFKTPFVPLVPILGIISALYLMINLPMITWAVMIGWLIVGLFIYFFYSIKHSKVQALEKAEVGD